MNLIVNFAPTGMIPNKEMSSYVPLTVSEVVEDVRQAVEIGITMVHLHARDPETGEPTYRAEVYAEMIEGIRRFAPDLVICVSLSGRTFKEFEKRSAPLQLTGYLKPDMGSLTLSSLNFNRETSTSEPAMIKALASEMKRRCILVEMEAFDSGMVNYAHYLQRNSLIEPPHYFNLILGNIACAQANLLHSGLMVNDLPPDSYWSFGGVGEFQLRMNALAIAMGGGVRVGLEDNIWYDQPRTRLASNLDLLQRIFNLAKYNGREVMKPAELRTILNLESGHGKYGRVFKTTDV
jgi:3-keto-5-aminohexanoate cleavage enzyme